MAASSSSVVERAVGALGVSAVSIDVAGLSEVYRQWCHRVPFDSLRKRVFQAGGAIGTVPGWTAEEFLADWLADGTGGSCWSTSLGLHAVLRELGFDARLVEATMLTDPDTRPNHGSVVVTADGEEWLVDSSMLVEHPVRLPPDGVVERRTDPLHPTVARGSHDHWTVTWRPAHADVHVDCEINRRPAERDRWDEAHERTRSHSLFNQALYARRNEDDGIVAIGRGKLVERVASGELVRRSLATDEIRSILVGRFGFSERIVDALPPDDDGPAFL